MRSETLAVLAIAILALGGCASTTDPPDCSGCPPRIIEVPAPYWAPPQLDPLPPRPPLTSAALDSAAVEAKPCPALFEAMAHDLGELLNHLDVVEAAYEAVRRATVEHGEPVEGDPP